MSASWKSADPVEWQLSSHNTKSGVDMACVRGVEARLGPWRVMKIAEERIDVDDIDQQLIKGTQG